MCPWPGLSVAAALLIPAVSQAATITVTATSDDVVNNGTCTLREAINEANANSDAAAVDCNSWSGGFGNDTIQLNATTYVLDDMGAGDNLNGTGRPGRRHRRRQRQSDHRRLGCRCHRH